MSCTWGFTFRFAKKYLPCPVLAYLNLPFHEILSQTILSHFLLSLCKTPKRLFAIVPLYCTNFGSVINWPLPLLYWAVLFKCFDPNSTGLSLSNKKLHYRYIWFWVFLSVLEIPRNFTLKGSSYYRIQKINNNLFEEVIKIIANIRCFFCISTYIIWENRW